MQLSSLSEYEYVRIATSLEILFRDKNGTFDCSKCQSFNEKRVALNKRRLSCDKLKPTKVISFVRGESELVYFKCPANFYDDSVQYLTTLVNAYKNGNIDPRKETAKLIEAIQMCNNFIVKMELEGLENGRK